MSAVEIIALLNSLASAIPQVIKLAQQASAAFSAEDQTSINAAIASLKASAEADLQVALTDLDQAATN